MNNDANAPAFPAHPDTQSMALASRGVNQMSIRNYVYAHDRAPRDRAAWVHDALAENLPQDEALMILNLVDDSSHAALAAIGVLVANAIARRYKAKADAWQAEQEQVFMPGIAAGSRR